MRPNARKIGVLVTDGKSQDDIIANSQNLRDQGIELYAIGESQPSSLGSLSLKLLVSVLTQIMAVIFVILKYSVNTQVAPE
jgi:hypothetical protein